MAIVHHHLIYQANIGRSFNERSGEELKKFLSTLVNQIGMQVLIEPNVKFSHQKAWTGLIGIITSHIAFHVWTVEKHVQLDIYSCKEFDRNDAIGFINTFFESSDVRTLFIDREPGKNFKIDSK